MIMNRRETLTSLFRREAKSQVASTSMADLTPYSGPWTFKEAAHLLRRTTFGPNRAMIERAVNQGLEATLNELFQLLPLPAPPINYNFTDDANVPVGETWVDAPHQFLPSNVKGYRLRSLNAWTLGLALQEDMNIREKMTLFWHNHFVVGLGPVDDSRFLYRNIHLLRTHALGNFKELTKAITIDPAMLRYLNGNQNRRNGENENYARELLELFTIGKGPLAGPGDYTNYTEEDIRQAAKILTGWTDTGFNATDPNRKVGSTFIANRHTSGSKTLSARFNNAVIAENGDKEYADLIDVIFQQAEVARFICRKLFRWFAHPKITPDIEFNVIQPMADLLIAQNYEINQVLRAFIGSSYFFDDEQIGCKIKSPMDFIFSVAGSLEASFDTTTPATYYAQWSYLTGPLQGMQQEYYNHPDVSGWKAYYQEPSYHQLWINSATLKYRTDLITVMTDRGFQGNGKRVTIDPLVQVDRLSAPFVNDPNNVIQWFGELLLPKALTPEQVNYLKEILLNGLPDFEWELEYQNHKKDPNNVGKANTVRLKLMAMLKAMLSLPEFQLS